MPDGLVSGSWIWYCVTWSPHQPGAYFREEGEAGLLDGSFYGFVVSLRIRERARGKNRLKIEKEGKWNKKSGWKIGSKRL